MRERFAFGTRTAKMQQTDRASGVHIASVKRLAGAIAQIGRVSIGSHPITGTRLIAIAGGTD